MRLLVSGARLPVALALCLAGVAGGSAVAAEAKVPELHIAEGRAYGVLDGRPLGAVLETFARATGLVYEVAVPLGGEPLSGRLDGLPAAEALVQLLRPFDYTAVWRTDGTIGRLKVTGPRTGLRNASGEEPEPSLADAMVADAIDGAVVEPEHQAIRTEETWWANLSEEELLEEARFMDLEALASETGVPVAHLYDDGSGGDGEPTLNLNLIANLLQQLENQAEQRGLQDQ